MSRPVLPNPWAWDCPVQDLPCRCLSQHPPPDPRETEIDISTPNGLEQPRPPPMPTDVFSTQLRCNACLLQLQLPYDEDDPTPPTSPTPAYAKKSRTFETTQTHADMELREATQAIMDEHPQLPPLSPLPAPSSQLTKEISPRRSQSKTEWPRLKDAARQKPKINPTPGTPLRNI